MRLVSTLRKVSWALIAALAVGAGVLWVLAFTMPAQQAFLIPVAVTTSLAAFTTAGAKLARAEDGATAADAATRVAMNEVLAAAETFRDSLQAVRRSNGAEQEKARNLAAKESLKNAQIKLAGAAGRTSEAWRRTRRLIDAIPNDDEYVRARNACLDWLAARPV
jgi:hypothetical protein